MSVKPPSTPEDPVGAERVDIEIGDVPEGRQRAADTSSALTIK
jgi:hypothetical protein